MTVINGVEPQFVNINLGVPQGSVLGLLLFIIFINDLPFFLINISSKLFADDTTLLFHGGTIDSVISSFKFGLKQIIEWYNYNRLFINWSKTFIMFVHNKRIITPTFLDCEGIHLTAVTKFKLLGFIIDQKFDFQSHVAHLCLTINRKLHSIKRLFYLPFQVKLQFFKSFILPYFDYGLSLTIYFHKNAIRKLCKLYYICLIKLFNFSFLDKSTRFSSIKSHDLINLDLKEHNLFSFHHRLVFRLISFIHKILFNFNSPVQLKSWLVINVNKELGVSLRSNDTQSFCVPKTKSKFGDMTFKNFFSRFLNKLNFSLFTHNFEKFKQDRLDNKEIYNDLNILLKYFPKFNCDLNFFYFHTK
jgi:hypothetical protein